MIQALIKKGNVLAENVPAPEVTAGCVLIRVTHSCISAGTEMSGVVTSGKSIYKRIKEQPEKVTKILNRVKVEGFEKVYKQMKGLLDAGQPTGYSVSGIVLAVGEGVKDFKPGDRVAAAGGGLAMHAEFVDVPVNLVVKLPDTLELKDASSVTLGAIAMHGVRRAAMQLGEYAVVIGTGILGLLAVQMLRCSGIRVIAIDPDQQRLDLAKELGAELVINPAEEDTITKVEIFTNGKGADAILFTAATSSSKPLSDAFKMCRRKGKVVLIGVSGMEINRADIYPKEIDLQISTSYGPGRYDKSYEEDGIDYPFAYVRWTEKRNLEEYLRLLSEKQVVLDKIINETCSVEEVTKAFNLLKNPENKPLMVVLDYGVPEDNYRVVPERTIQKNKNIVSSKINIALIGTGNFATNMHLPNLAKLKSKYNIYAVAGRTGYKAKNIADQYGASYFTTDYNEILNDENVDLIIICTQHEDHAQLTLNALSKGKNVFVEKPLTTNKEDLEKIKTFFETTENPPLLMVGYNRRFSPAAREIKKHTDKRISPLFIQYRMNAGYMKADHWVFKQGGRIIGEACHIVDLMNFLTGSEIESIATEELTFKTEHYTSSDNKAIVLKYKDGSVVNIQYFSVGAKNLPKEYMEIHFENKSIVMEDYKKLKGFGVKIKEMDDKTGDKGHMEELNVLYNHLTEKSEGWPVMLNDLIQTSHITLNI